MKHIIIPALALVLAGCATSEQLNTIDGFVEECADIGGTLQKTYSTLLVDRYDCYINGKLVLIDGYSGRPLHGTAP